MELTVTNRSRAYPEGFVKDWMNSICGFEGMLDMHEWLSGGVSPCQGEGRGFESRLVLFL